VADGGGASARHLAWARERRLFDFLGDVVAGRTPRERPVDDDLAGLLRACGLTVLAARMGLRHASFAAVERDLFVRTGRVEQVSGWCVEVLDAAGLRCVTLKGPALAMQLYGDDVTRPSSDVDLLVSRPELEHALEALGDAGLRFGTRHATWYERRWRHHLVAGGAPVDRGLPVEVHWSFGGPGLIAGPIERLFDDAVAVDCAGRRLPAPSLAWQLLVCAVHAAQHYFPPRLLLDVALIAGRLDSREWRTVVDLAHELGIAPALYYATTVAARRLGGEVPAAVEGLRPAPWRDAVATRAIAHLPAVGRPSRSGMQAMKAVVPLMITTSERLPVALAYQLTDRPRLADALSRRAALQKAGRA
jgi:Uncharacterised nucleotidyltransferase